MMMMMVEDYEYNGQKRARDYFFFSVDTKDFKAK